MRCIVCKHGETSPGKTTMSVDRGGRIVVIRGVPADICTTCGEEYIGAETMRAIETAVTKAEGAGIDIAVREFEAA